MPPPVRRKTLVLVLALGAALAFAAVAYAGNGGFAPETPHSPNAQRINDTYKWIAIFTFTIFVVVEGSLLWFVFRYRRGNRSRTAEGPQIHAHTRLELIWTVIPVLILVAIASFLFYKLPGIKNVPTAQAQGGEPLRVRIDAHQFYWQFTYPNGAVSIDELHAPVNQVVRVDIYSRDVAHSWWIPELGGKFDAIPGQHTHTWFKADQAGTYKGRCGEFCGVFHAEMAARVFVQSRSDYDSWLSSAAGDLGRSEWAGVCAKCHGLHGEGGYGPAIANSGVLVQDSALRRLLTEGQNRIKPISSYMPPVGLGWTDAQFTSLEQYLKQNIYKAAKSGG
jgi:cytochrome c oxidase subunit 2